MKGPTIEVVEPRLFDGAAADEIVTCLGDAIEEHGSASLVLSGGSTPSGTYRALSRPPRVSAVPWDKVRCYLGDERWVASDDNQSNIKLVNETLLNQLDSSKPKAFFPQFKKGAAEEGARDYERILRSTEKCESGVPELHLLLLGVGEDGHIASVFPGSPLISAKGERLTAAVDRPEGGLRGVTLTPQVLLKAARIIFLVKGEAKAQIVQRAIEGSEPAEQLPARLLAPIADRVTWFLDTGAAQALAR